MSTFVMRPETEVTINEATKEKPTFNLFFGVWTNVKKMAKGEEFGFKGSQAVAGIRKRWTFVMEETGEETTLKVIEGDVELTDNAKGKTENVRTGEALSASEKGLGAKTMFDIEKKT